VKLGDSRDSIVKAFESQSYKTEHFSQKRKSAEPDTMPHIAALKEFSKDAIVRMCDEAASSGHSASDAVTVRLDEDEQRAILVRRRYVPPYTAPVEAQDFVQALEEKYGAPTVRSSNREYVWFYDNQGNRFDIGSAAGSDGRAQRMAIARDKDGRETSRLPAAGLCQARNPIPGTRFSFRYLISTANYLYQCTSIHNKL
jgi:hypothetical protein